MEGGLSQGRSRDGTEADDVEALTADRTTPTSY